MLSSEQNDGQVASMESDITYAHPAMGLEIKSLDYILSHDSIYLKIVKIGFPYNKGPVYLESHKDKSA